MRTRDPSPVRPVRLFTDSPFHPGRFKPTPRRDSTNLGQTERCGQCFFLGLPGLVRLCLPPLFLRRAGSLLDLDGRGGGCAIAAGALEPCGLPLPAPFGTLRSAEATPESWRGAALAQDGRLAVALQVELHGGAGRGDPGHGGGELAAAARLRTREDFQRGVTRGSGIACGDREVGGVVASKGVRLRDADQVGT